MRQILAILLTILLPIQALSLNLIRDAEVEQTLHKYGEPIFRAANLNPDSVRIFIVNDPTLNAFTVGGLNLFINTGLITRTEDSNMIIGVMAHETGHIAGGHIIKKIGEVDDLNIETILTTVLGAAVSVAGLPGAGMGVMAAGQHVATRNYMSFNRQQEVAADAAAIRFLGNTHQSVRGMLKLFEILRRDQTLNYGDIDPYAISHPLSQERMEHIRSQAMVEDKDMPDQYANEHARMVAKLYGFLEKPDNVFYKYTDNSVPARYARSIAYFRQSKFDKSFAELDSLLAESPDDPFFNELKGQFLTESGKAKEAIPYYQKANQLYPNSALIKNELGKIMLGENMVDQAIAQLSQSSKLESTNAETWHLLATAYGKKNQEAVSNLMLAEEARVLGKNNEARKFARLAKDKLPKDSPGAIRAADILADIKLDKKKDKNNEDDK